MYKSILFRVTVTELLVCIHDSEELIQKPIIKPTPNIILDSQQMGKRGPAQTEKGDSPYTLFWNIYYLSNVLLLVPLSLLLFTYLLIYFAWIFNQVHVILLKVTKLQA